MLATNFVGLDFETYSVVNLPVNGLYNYTHDDSFQPLLAAVCYEKDAFETETEVIDFIAEGEAGVERLKELIDGKRIAAHNAGFEQAVLEAMGIDLPSQMFIDTAVLARAAGAAGKLEAAAPQLLGVDKFEMGAELIKLFSIPGEYQEIEENNFKFDPKIIENNRFKWNKFKHYCGLDAELSFSIAKQQLPQFPYREQVYNAITMDMNKTGWFVDVELVEEMYERYVENNKKLIEEFRVMCDAPDLNVYSYPQLKEWCAKRGVKSDSFDEQNCGRLIKQIQAKMMLKLPEDKKLGYWEVIQLLETKKKLGGSSLKKLSTILQNVGEDDSRLHDQYLHIGAGATYRTTGRNVQMQNLPRLHGGGDDVLELFEDEVEWDNEKMSHNLRQVFCATEEEGMLIVGDFSSVESRGLAWQAGEQWKLDAYTHGKDLYVEQAARIFRKPVESVTKEDRLVGKIAELACGYGAGAGAVRNFAKNMGVDLSEGEAGKLVKDWRDANEEIVKYWRNLNDALHDAITTWTEQKIDLPFAVLEIMPVTPPESLRKIAPNSVSLRIQMSLRGLGRQILKRMIHGCEALGRSITYYKPSERKSGQLWVNTFMDAQTKMPKQYTLYGGKLAGILTQSLCREVFFMALEDIANWCTKYPNVKLVGQFHDEIVLDWNPGDGLGASYFETYDALHKAMTQPRLVGFPINAEIKKDFRYTK